MYCTGKIYVGNVYYSAEIVACERAGASFNNFFSKKIEKKANEKSLINLTMNTSKHQYSCVNVKLSLF